MLALRNLRDKYPQYRTMTLAFESNPMVRIEARARPRLGRTIQASARASPWTPDGTLRGESLEPCAGRQLDGWLFYDFRMSDPLAYRILGMPEKGLTSRRWFCFIPADGAPWRWSRQSKPIGSTRCPFAGRIVYRSEREMIAALAGLMQGRRRIAMNYSAALRNPVRLAGRCRHDRTGALDGRRSGYRGGSDSALRGGAGAAQLAGHRRGRRALRAIVAESFR